MGNCGSNPKTDEGPEPVPLPAPVPVTEEVKVEHAVKETPIEDNKSLITLLKENVEESKKKEGVKAEAKEVKAEPKIEKPKNEVLKVQEEEPQTEEKKMEAFFAKREG
ncbi:unnamed protein product [Vicia faba]|uniref:Uncharacterized protein n=1 Tax=Vicia faba TaxID=3906 RepID=A0AAV1B941_VICFA|nr:unnamed protein product [Vicia faba]